MAGIDNDSAVGGSDAQRQPELTPMERVEQKMIACGVPEEQLQEHQEGLLMYLEEHREKLHEITTARMARASRGCSG